jgi:Leucine-rich repeat (LRR) protein
MSEIDTLIEIENVLDTFLIIEQQQLHYYQVVTENIWGLKSYSNTLPSDYLVSIGDNKFSVLNTVSLSQENSSSIDIIPNQIGELINLKWVDFSSSQISGEIPNAIENLTNLEYLNLSSNQISGEIPNEFENLTNLEYLNLSSNQISGEIPNEFENLINLEYLNLSSNQISGEIPIILYSLTNLEKLSLNNNELLGEINTEINNLINLNDINFQENQLSGIIPPEICYFFNRGISVNLRYNRLCPPYLICNTINEYFIFGQDTTDCN